MGARRGGASPGRRGRSRSQERTGLRTRRTTCGQHRRAAGGAAARARARGRRTGLSSSARSRASPPSTLEDAELLLRPRAARGRVGGAAHRCAVDGRRGSVRERQVVRAAGRAARCARSRRACRAAMRWAIALLRPGEHPLAGTRAGLRRRSRPGPAGRRRRPVRGDSSRPAATRTSVGVRRRARQPRSRSAPPRARARCRPRRLLRPLRRPPELSRLLGANHVLVGPMRRDELRRAIELPARRAGLQVEPELVDALVADVEGRAGRAAAAVDRVARALAAARRAVPAAEPPTSTPAASTARWRGWPRRLRAARPGPAAYVARRSCCGSPARASRGRACGACRSPNSTSEARRARCRGARRLAERAARHDRRGRGRGRARGAAARVAAPAWLAGGGRRGAPVASRTCARPRAGGQLAGRDPGELYRGARLAAALDWSAAHRGELNASRARLPGRRAAPRASARSAACASLLAGVGGAAGRSR